MNPEIYNGKECAIQSCGYSGSNPAVKAALAAMFTPDLPSLNFSISADIAGPTGGKQTGGVGGPGL